MVTMLRGRSLPTAETLLATLGRHVIVSITDATGRIVFANDPFCQLSGYAPEELCGEDHRIVNSGHHPRTFWSEMWQRLRSGHAWRGTICNRAKDRSLYWVDSTIAPVTDAQGRITHFVSARHDVTNARHAESRAAQVGRLLQTSFDEIYVFAAETLRLLEVSEGAKQNLGYSSEELLELTPLDLKPRFTREEFDRLIDPLRRGDQQLLVFETAHRRKDGTEYPVEVRLQFMGGDPPAFMAIIQDITERKLATDALARHASELERLRDLADAANAAKTEFLANMSHEIRTPLTAILGYAELLRDDGDRSKAPERRLQTLETIVDAGQHLLTIINDVLDLSKIEAGKLLIESVETPLVQLLGDVANLLRPRAFEKGIGLDLRLSTPLPEFALLDPTRLRQILVNLLGNAVKFTSKGGVTLRAGREQGQGVTTLVIDVEDSGVGVGPGQADRIFAPFGQADSTVTREHGGTGLGLTITRRLARRMGGDVELVRSEPGEGSQFRVWLPIVPVPGSAEILRLEPQTERPRVRRPPSGPTLSGRILLAEDNPVNQRLVVLFLEKAGAEVDVAANGLVALELIEEAAANGRPYQLLLTDMQMPVMDGYVLARTLRERGNALPIVALTAHAMEEDRRRCCEAGCDDYATKPIERAALLQTCEKWIAKAAAGPSE